MSRVFFTDQVTFTYLTVPEVDVDDTVLAYVYLNGSGSVHTVLAQVPGQIVEDEYSPGLFRYNITDFEVPSDTVSVSITWAAFVSSVAVDGAPISSVPTLRTELTSDFLVVSTASPVNGTTGVDVRSQMVLTFDETLDPNALVEGQMFLRRAGTPNVAPVTALISSVNSAILTVTPLDKLDNNTTYELHIPVGTIAGLTGAGLATDYKLTFKTSVDDVATLYQATDQGVVERRAGPLKIISTATAITLPGVSSSLPADLSCNQSSSEIVFTFSEDVDPYNSIPVLDFTFAPIFDRPSYYLNNSLWANAETEPTHPTDVIDGGGVKARGGILFAAQPNDTETITIGDGTISVTFEFDDNATFTDTQVVIGATLADTVTNLVTAIEASALAMTALDNTLLLASSVLLVHDATGVSGNVTVTTTSSATVSGLSGGINATEVVPFTTVTIAGKTVTVTFNQSTVGNAYATINLTGLVTEADPSMSFVAAEITYITALFPMRISVPEIRNCIRRYLAEDITDCDIALLIAQVGLDLYDVYLDNAVIQQLCVIKSTVVILLLEDYMADAGLDGMKQLGPFTVSNKSTWLMNGPYKRWKEKLEECIQTLNAFFNTPVSGIKSSNNVLERPTGSWRIRTWNSTASMHPYRDENKSVNRAGKIPPRGTHWS